MTSTIHSSDFSLAVYFTFSFIFTSTYTITFNCTYLYLYLSYLYLYLYLYLCLYLTQSSAFGLAHRGTPRWHQHSHTARPSASQRIAGGRSGPLIRSIFGEFATLTSFIQFCAPLLFFFEFPAPLIWSAFSLAESRRGVSLDSRPKNVFFNPKRSQNSIFEGNYLKLILCESIFLRCCSYSTTIPVFSD